MYKILIADDHPLFREAIVNAIQQTLSEPRILESEDLDHALAFAREQPDIDLVLLDLDMPGMDGLTGLTTLRAAAPTMPVAIISAENNRQVVLQAMAQGAVGYISKSSSREKLMVALQQILNGDVYLPPDIIRQNNAPAPPPAETRPATRNAVPPAVLQSLTRRQLRVLEQMVKGESNKEIAAQLSIAETTVKSHVSAILAKLGVRSRLQAILAAGEIDFSEYLRR